MVAMTFFVLIVLLMTVPPAFLGDTKHTCPEKIKTFSFGVTSELYYSCNGKGSIPILKRCPDGNTYWPYREACYRQNAPSEHTNRKVHGGDLRTYTQPTFGRNVLLGDLFNANNNDIMTGYSLWKPETIVKSKVRRTAGSTRVSFSSAGSTTDRLNHMHITRDLKMELLSGLVSAKGSAEFLEESLESENAIAVALKYKTATHWETLPVMTPKDYDDQCSLKTPTHVVSGINHGVGANFIFQKPIENIESKGKMSREMKAVVKLIPHFKVQSGSKVNISASVAEVVKDVDVKLFSDFILSEEPTSYEESIATYHELHYHVGTPPQYEGTVPVEMTLTPIRMFCEKKDTTFIRISPTIIDSINVVFAELEQTKVKVDTIRMEDILLRFPPLQNTLVKFTTELTKFHDSVQSDVQALVPSIREGVGNSSEEALILLLNRYADSPFNRKSADAFLEARRKEISSLKYIVDPAMFDETNIKVLSYSEARAGRVLYHKKMVLMLKFNILTPEDIVDRFLKGEKTDESKSWFNRPETIGAMGKQFDEFAKFSAANIGSENNGYLLAISDVKKNPINVYAQKEGHLITDLFMFPELAETMNPVSISYNSMQFHVKRPNNTWVESFNVKYWIDGKTESATVRTFQFTDGNMTAVDVDGLMPHAIYVFSMQYHTVAGMTPPSQSSVLLATKPCSPPTNVRIETVASLNFTVTWSEPIQTGVNVTKYRVSVAGRDFIKIITVAGITRAVFMQLTPATVYSVSVTAIADGETHNKREESAAAILKVVTRPDPPSSPTLLNRSLHSAEVQWAAPWKVADGAVIQGYRLKYMVVNNLGNESVSGSEQTQPLTNETFTRIEGLILGTKYAVSVKVLTSLGNSGYSEQLIIQTLSNDTLLLKTVETLKRSMEKKYKDMLTKSTKQEREIGDLTKLSTITENFYYPLPFIRMSSCGGTMNWGGTLAYPESGNYGDNEDCTWYVKTGTPTILTFTRFDTENNCPNYDFVRVYDNGVLRGKWCGTVIPPPIKTTGNVQIDFHSDSGDTSRGFVIHIAVRNAITAQRYYPQYGATFLGYGQPTSFNSTVSYYIEKPNITACIETCRNHFLVDQSWNGLKINVRDDPNRYHCICYKNDAGHLYSEYDFHYRIAST